LPDFLGWLRTAWPALQDEALRSAGAEPILRTSIRPLKHSGAVESSRLRGLASGATMATEFRRVNDGFVQKAAHFHDLRLPRPAVAAARR
jgi:hypothetical protein